MAGATAVPRRLANSIKPRREVRVLRDETLLAQLETPRIIPVKPPVIPWSRLDRRRTSACNEKQNQDTATGYQSINQSIDQSIKLTTNRTDNQSINQPIDQGDKFIPAHWRLLRIQHSWWPIAMLHMLELLQATFFQNCLPSDRETEQEWWTEWWDRDWSRASTKKIPLELLSVPCRWEESN